MPKNIIIFSDGTGQAGGINFDEARTNIYKLYRACRVAPDTSIDPSEQVAFYDAGLGSAADGGHFKNGFLRALYNLASKATGLGITANIIDCYAALIRLYRDGDRVFLIGFSRGAYTMRTLAGVMTQCGIPRHLPDGLPLPLDEKGSRDLASHAVKDVYQFCSSYDRKEIGAYLTFIMDTRAAIAAKFRSDHGCSDAASSPEKANVFPYFIGVFDTVAALGHKGLATLVIFLIAGAMAVTPYLIKISVRFFSLLLGSSPFGNWFGNLTYTDVLWVVGPLYVLLAAYIYLKNYLKWAPALPGYSLGRRLKTIHFARFKQQFYDTTLNPNVAYAKHAISIDENRADFKRVHWVPSDQRIGKVDAFGNNHFEQVWFPGVHADIGGGYDENGSRLSDVALKWMLAGASLIPNGLKHDDTVLNLHPDAGGPQHNEQKGSFLKFSVRAINVPNSPMHKSVYERFAAGVVVLFDKSGLYRPQNMSKHVDFAQYFDSNNTNPKAADPPQAMAEDIEARWQKIRDAVTLPTAGHLI